MIAGAKMFPSTLVVGAIAANLFGWPTLIAAGANFVYLLVRDETMFSWGWVAGSGCLFLASITLLLFAMRQQVARDWP